MILWISDCPDSAGGFGIVTKNILHYLKESHTVASVCFARFAVGEYDGYKVYPFARPFHHMLSRVESENGEKVEAVVVHGAPWITPFKDILNELQAVRARRVPVLGYFVHEALAMPPEIESYFRPGVLFDALITPTVATAELANVDNYYVVPHGVDPEVWHPHDVEKFDRFTIAFVSKNHPRKRWDLFFRVLATLIKEGLDVQGLAWTPRHGYWDIEKVLWAIEKDEGVKIPVIMPNPYDATFGIPNGKLAELLSKAHAYLHMSMGEAWGLPITEALALGLPTAAIDYPAIREWAGDWVNYIPTDKKHLISVEGLIHPVPSINKAVQWVEEVYSNYEDYRVRAIRNSDKVSKKYGWDAAGKRMEKVISGFI